MARTFGGTLDAVVTDTRGNTLAGINVHAWDAAAGGVALGTTVSGVDGSFELTLDTTAPGVYVSAGTTGPRRYVPAREAVPDLVTSLANKTNNATTAALSDRVDTTETRVGTVEDAAAATRPRPPTVVLFGDSRTANCDFTDALNAFSTNMDWFGFGQYAATGGPALEVIRNAGIGGNTTAQLLARMDADVIAHAPGYMTLWGGTNDVWADTTSVDATVTNVVAMLDKAKAAGIYVFLCGETTSSTKGTAFPGLVRYYNERLRRLAQTRDGIEFWDFNSVIQDPLVTNGYPKSALLSDGVHLNAAGASALGFQVVAPALSRLQGRLAKPPTSVTDSKGVDANSLNIVSNPLMTSTGGTLGAGDSGTLAGSWLASGSPTAVYANPARTDGYGKDIEAAITATGGGAKWLNQTISAARLTAGGTYVIEAVCDIVAPVNLASVSATLQVSTSGGNYEFGLGKNSTAPGTTENVAAASGLILRSRAFTLPSGVTITGGTLVLTHRFGAAGSATVRWGRVSVKKISGL